MSRLTILTAALLFAAALSFAVAGCRPAPPPDLGPPPNVLLLVIDCLRADHLGVAGYERATTPNLDALATEGIRFTRHYAGSPVCAPSRCALLTGLHSGHAFIRDNRENGGWGPHEPEGQLELPAGTVTVGHLLRRAGYTTGAIGKW